MKLSPYTIATPSAPRSRCARPRLISGGQTAVEVALVAPILVLMMVGVIQVILIGSAALAVNQAAVACARYASLNPSLSQSSLDTYLKNIASPLINDAELQTVALTPAPTRATGTSLSVTVTYVLSAKLFLSSSFFGITFPNRVSVTETMTSE